VTQTAAERDAQAHTDRALMARDISELRKEMVEHRDEQRAEIANLRASIQSLVTAWSTANTIVAVAKWASSITIAISALWYVVTHFGEGK
jgi:hypothetical protein